MTGVLFLLLVTAPQPLQPFTPPFDAAMERYRGAAGAQIQCDDEAAVKSVSSYDVPTLRALAREVGRPSTRYNWPRDLVASAVVLHTRVFLTFGAEEEEQSSAHLAAAKQLLTVLEHSDRDLYSRLAPYWYAVVAAHLQSKSDVVALWRHVGGVPIELSRHPLLLLARGSLHQLLASPMITRDVRLQLAPPPSTARLPEWVATEQRVHRDLAKKDFRAAIEAAPSDPEAYIRLADLLAATDRITEGAVLIAQAHALSRDPVPAYWASLVDGRIREMLSDFDGAQRAFERAAALFQHAQTPRLALSRLMLATGRSAAGGAVLRTYLAASPDVVAEDDDPWWDYRSGQWWRVKFIIRDMLLVVRHCDAP